MPVGAKATLTPNPITMASGPSGSNPVPFEQEARDLGAVEQQVVGPFQGEARRADSRDRLHRLVQREARHETELRCERRARTGRSAEGSHRGCPGGDDHCRPCRPLPASCSAAAIQSCPGSPDRAACRASSFVESVASSETSRYPADSVSGDSCTIRTATAQRRPLRPTSGAGTMPNRTTKMLLDSASTSFTPVGHGIVALARRHRSTSP